MTTGVELITEIATLSSEIADLTRFIEGHPMSMQTTAAYRMRDFKIAARKALRKDLAELPELTFS